jgi:hypothetical protein
LEPPGDVTNDLVASVLDVQCSVLANLWSLAGQTGQVPDCIQVPGSPAVVVDHNCDSVINVADTLLAIQFALKVPLNPIVDPNNNQCVDACETDLDGDGTFDVLDCAPHNPNVSDTATEVCNGYDDDCNGLIDGAAAEIVANCSDNNVCDGVETCQVIPTDLGVIITEIMYDPSAVADTAGEWFELFNSGTTSVNIQGWRITDQAGETHVINAGGALFVPPRGYLVLARNTNINTNGGVRAAYQYAGFDLVNAGDTIALLDQNLVLRDRVQWGPGLGFPNGNGKSIALKDVRLNNEVGANWASSTLSLVADPGTPWGPNADAVPSFCQETTPLVCNDGNLCTDDGCNAATGCTAVPNTLPCNDGEICTISDTCAGGSCVGGGALPCSDGNVCTDDACVPGVGCAFTNNTAACDDGNACTAASACANGACTGSSPVVCDDNNPCTTDSCNPASGCVFTNNTLPCNDGNACTTGDVCAAGSCAGGAPLVCNDSNPCTNDSCAPASGCVFANNTASCSDGNACTTSDVCSGGVCQGGPALVCNDSNNCTNDSCNPASGCVFAPNNAACTDDNNPCTTDQCNPATGTCGIPAPNGTSCSDGEQCTVPDTCQAGQCVSADLPQCFDGTSNVLCVLSGAANSVVTCPIRLAAASGSQATALQLKLSYPAASLKLLYFTDGQNCFGPNGGPPCIPNIITGNPPSQMITGHQVTLTGGNVNAWTSGGELLIIDFGNPANALTEATYSGGLITGDSLVFDAVFTLKQTISGSNPIWVAADPSKNEPVVAADSEAQTLNTVIDGALIITSAP